MPEHDDHNAAVPVHQTVRSENGYAYGAVGADIHVFGSGDPLYLLFEYHSAPPADPAWLQEQLSRLLDTRAAVVEFTGRERDRQSLIDWRDRGPHLAARWLHGPGGQGKTRLSHQFAEDSARSGWMVVVAVHGTDTQRPQPGSQNLVTANARGILLLVDYADRWPLSHLSWLFNNGLLKKKIPIRILLLARSVQTWPGVRAKLSKVRADTSDQRLSPLPEGGGERERMFTAARDSFVDCYGLPDDNRRSIIPPGPLDQEEFGLTLAVHMAALVAVDAHVHGRRPPSDMVGLTTYLLDREHEHWGQLHDNATDGLDYHTLPQVMARTVFTAVLTGATSRPAALAVLDRLGLHNPGQRLLTDHRTCYPPTDVNRANVLEPLLPDRLAEDFLALTFTGSPVTGFPTDTWADTTPADLLAPAADTTTSPHTRRAIIFLAAAAERWPHVGRQHLYPLLDRHPSLAVDAGSAALAALADVVDIPPKTLTAIKAQFPRTRAVDLDQGIAAVTARLAIHQLAEARSPAEMATVNMDLAYRLRLANLVPQAIDALEAAIAIYRNLGAGVADHQLAQALGDLGGLLPEERSAEAAAASQEALALRQGEVERSKPPTPSARLALGAIGLLSSRFRRRRRVADFLREAGLAIALHNRGVALAKRGQPEEALTVLQEAIAIRRSLFAPQADIDSIAAADGEASAGQAAQAWLETGLASSLSYSSRVLTKLGRPGDGIEAAEEACRIMRRLAAANPAAYEPDLASTLKALGNCLTGLKRDAEALGAVREAAEICRRLATVNPSSCDPDLAVTLADLGNLLLKLGWDDEAINVRYEALAVARRLDAADHARYRMDLAYTLALLGAELAEPHQLEESVAVLQEAVGLLRPLDPRKHGAELACILDDLADRLSGLGRHVDALAASREAMATRLRVSEADPTSQEYKVTTALADLADIAADLGPSDIGAEWDAEYTRSMLRDVEATMRMSPEEQAAFAAEFDLDLPRRADE